MKNKLYYLMLAVGEFLVVFSLVNKNKNEKNNMSVDENSINELVEIEPDSGNQNMTSNFIDGVLRFADDSNKGNLKLVSKDGDIYIRTSRDYSHLIGLQVSMLVNGTLDNFE